LQVKATNHADYSDSLSFVIEHDCYLHLNLANQRKQNHYAAKKDVPYSPFIRADCPFRWLAQCLGDWSALCLRQGSDGVAQAGRRAYQRYDGEYGCFG
jgi:hypothetical protein